MRREYGAGPRAGHRSIAVSPAPEPSSVASRHQESAVSDTFEPAHPGPTPLPDRVREAGSRQMVNHRGPEFKELINRVTGGHEAAFVTATTC